MTIPKLATILGMSKGGLYTSIANGSIKVSTLEKIAEILKVPVLEFFDEENEKWTKATLTDEVKKLDEENEVLWNRINELMDTIRAKRSILRLTYNQLKALQDKRLDGITEAIDESEKFENPELRIRKRTLGLDLGTNSIGMAILNTEVNSDKSIIEGLADTYRITSRVKRAVDKRSRVALQKVINDLVILETKIDKSTVLDEKDIISVKSLLDQSNEIINNLE